MMAYLTKCNKRGPACTCSTECSEKIKAGSATPAFVKHEVAKAIKSMCSVPYLPSPSFNTWGRRHPTPRSA